MTGLVIGLAAAGTAAAADLEWNALPALPNQEGFSGMFAGTSGGALLAAGGTNFPSKKPWEGGSKAYYDTVYVLDGPNGTWQFAGKLPRPLGYGASVETPSGVLCIGGATEMEHHTECFLLEYRDGKLSTRPFPPLPRPCANLCAASVDSTVYVAGGLETPSSTEAMKTFWSLDLQSPEHGWRELPACPGPARILAVAAGFNDAFYLLSGASLSAGPDGKPVRTYLRDAWRFTPTNGWERLPDLPRAAVAAPSPAPVNDGQIEVLGGDDGSLATFEPKALHPGFPKRRMEFDATRKLWTEADGMPCAPVTCPVAAWLGGFVLVGGEVRPGVRTHDVWKVR